MAGVLKQAGQAFAQQDRVVGEDHSHGAALGSVAVILVGPPAGLSTSKRPSSARIRRSSPASPLPDGSAPPCPSSEITMFIVWSSWVRTTRMSRACACLVALVIASRATK